MSKDKSNKNWFAKHKVLTVIGVLVILAIIGAASGGSKSTNNKSANATTSSSSNSSVSTQTAAATPKLNQPANDGKFQFTITSFSCGQTQITQPDNSYSTSQAQGQFCQMNLNIKNIGTVAQNFDDSSQYVYDSNNKQYSASSDGTITANPSSSQFATLENVNPGVSISGIVVFDVPKSVTPVYAMLHDSGASNGVKVNLQ